MRAAGRLLAQAASLAAWRRPRSRLAILGFGAFVVAWLLATLAFIAQERAYSESGATLDASGLWIHAGFAATWLLAAWLAARALRRPEAWLTLATLAALVAIPWAALDMGVRALLFDFDEPPLAATMALALVPALVAVRLAWVVGDDGLSRTRRLAAGMLFAALLAPTWMVRTESWLWWQPASDEMPPELAAMLAGREAPPELDASIDIDALIDRQPALVDARVQALAPQVPGEVDLFAVGFAGYGPEAVFRNEVEYLQQLLPRRFGSDRVVPLVNHKGTIDDVPVASLTNLRRALAGVAARMDREEDVLLLFLTSHGSDDHVLAVDLSPLPLRQVDARDLRAALDDAGIQWRVLVVSACYSGGFIDELKTPQTLVVTAARADRPSFGCGSDSDITWFGKAFLAGALNRTTDFREAHALAARDVAAWEKAKDYDPSEPQFWAGARIEAHLTRWRAGFTPGATVAFVPAVPAKRPKPTHAPQ